MLSIVSWTKTACILKNSTMSFQHHTCHQGACINWCINFSGYIPVTSRRITLYTLVITSAIICLRGMMFMVSSHPFVTASSLLQLLHEAAHGQECDLSTSHNWKTLQCVSTAGSSRTVLPHFHHRVLCSHQTSRPNTRAPTFRHLGSLLVNTKDSSFSLTLPTDIMFSFAYINMRWLSLS